MSSRYNRARSAAVVTALCGVALISACDNRDRPTGAAEVPVAPTAIVTADDYARAERFLPWNADKYVLNGKVTHHWIGSSDRFWYQRQTKDGGKEFVLVNAENGKKQPAFDHEKVAAGLTSAAGELPDAAGEKYTPDDLPFDDFSYANDETAIDVTVKETRWRCGLAEGKCTQAPPGPGPGDLVSPDGKWAAFLKGPDLWLRSLETGEERALTSDGEARFAYGAVAGSSTVKITLQRKGEPVPPVALWSPDSKKLVTEKLDERRVPDTYLVQHAPEDGGVRPVLYRYPYAMPVDEQRPAVEIHLFNIEKGTATKMRHAPLPSAKVGPVSAGGAWWGNDGEVVYLASMQEGHQRLQLLKIDVATGETDVVIEETSDTFIGGVNGRDGIRPLAGGEVVWASERDGWNHLYLYGPDGSLERRLTTGDWAVRSIVHVDEENRKVYFTANGREAGEDVYYRRLYAVDLDTGDPRLITPENADHEVVIANRSPVLAAAVPSMPSPAEAAFSPSGRYFIERYSRVDMPPVTVLRQAGGSQIAILEQADISALEKERVTFPEPFQVLAADGKTPIYGNIHRPTHFDPARSYPVIDAIYPGPQSIRTKKDFMGALFDDAHAIAELGFIVVTIDGRGTPYRSKAFIDDVYGHFEKAGNLEDHIAAIKQLAERFPYMDLDRVGIYGHSGGGFASTRAILSYPDFYKVAVSSAGNHDQRGYTIAWGPRYAGLYDEQANDYLKHVNAGLAANLKGKLFLVHGELDDNVHPALTLQLADALIKANKDFDLLILPNTAHKFGRDDYGTYFQRRRWDYFVRHLLDAKPPENYKVAIPGEDE